VLYVQQANAYQQHEFEEARMGWLLVIFEGSLAQVECQRDDGVLLQSIAIPNGVQTETSLYAWRRVQQRALQDNDRAGYESSVLYALASYGVWAPTVGQSNAHVEQMFSTVAINFPSAATQSGCRKHASYHEDEAQRICRGR